ncbi:MAG: rhomboid family intramembrane serine protease [Acidobacteria bacterium]|nr:rhomboid family intramembrane serine protease [Acidobacteriota bacterium]
MRSYTRYPGSSFGISSYFPRGVKWLLIINFAVFVFFFFLGMWNRDVAISFLEIFGLRPSGVLRGAIWQPFTYLFLHGGYWHILFNMLTLWMFGADLEREWGTRRFLNYYFVCGVGAALMDVAVNLALHKVGTLTIGASGAIYGVLLAFGLLYPTRTVYFSFLFPIQAKYFVLIMGGIAFMSSFDRGSAVSNVAHLGGMIFGYLYLRFRLHRLEMVDLRGLYLKWRRRRLQQKFQVYMRKQERNRDQDQGGWVN